MREKHIFWVRTEIKTPPFSEKARIEAGTLLRKLQYGELLPMPSSRPMPSIGAACYELRINDTKNELKWRIIYHISEEAIVVLGSFPKKTGKTPKQLIDNCRKRLKEYHSLMNTEQMS